MKFGEGQPTDHGGRPRKPYSVTSMLREYGDEVDAESGLTRAQRLAKRLWGMVDDGDKWAIGEVVDRLEGKPKERVEIKDISSNPIYEMLNKLTQQNVDTEPEADQLHSEEQS